ncbi:DUF4331 family protein [Parasediminibacterium sp. JCM 36343]|uniref:DUF4331 family protein n=1 Tax=Parasediminibacterium sp. JCM 36343 TaxID=3374279 RepID=UPI00397B6AEF
MKQIVKLLTASMVCLVMTQTIAKASSHREAPLISNDPLADNTDLYAFRSPVNTDNIVLIANYIPFEHPAGGPNWYTFGENIRYEIHIKNQTSTTGDDITYRFTFKQVNEDSTTFFSIRLGKQNLKTTYTLERSIAGGVFVPIVINGVVPPPNIGPRSIENATVGLGATSYDSLMKKAIATATTGEKVFAGPVDDPFFVDLGGAFDAGGFRKTGKDGLAKFNCHSLVIEVPISTLQKAGKTAALAANILDPDYVIGVYASASRPSITVLDSTGGKPTASGTWIQVSRLGMPLTNEAVIPIGQKDKWNATATNSAGEGDFIPYFKNPELALYMDDSQFGKAVPGMSDLRIQTKSLGSFDFRNGKKGLYGLKGSPAVKGTALDDAIFGTILLPDSTSPRAVDILPIFYTGVPNLAPYQLATGKTTSPLNPGKPFINNFLPTLGDMLRLNMAVPPTPRNSADFSSLGIIQAAVLGLTDARYTASGTALQFIPNMDGFPNGRRLEDDVTTIELQAVAGVTLAAVGLWYDDYNGTGSPVTPNLLSVVGFNAGITHNDTTFKANFPYVQSPWRGFNGPGYVGPVNTPLPVSFVDFNAKATSGKVVLTWDVANQVNNDHYEIEQSTGGSVFATIGKVKATGATSYTFTDVSPSAKVVNYYRIKQVDADGKFTYSPIRSVKFDAQVAFTVSPNPATNYINVYGSVGSPLNIHLYNISGKELAVKTLGANGAATFNVASLAKGIYIVVAESNGVRVQTKNIVKE